MSIGIRLKNAMYLGEKHLTNNYSITNAVSCPLVDVKTVGTPEDINIFGLSKFIVDIIQRFLWVKMKKSDLSDIYLSIK